MIIHDVIQGSQQWLELRAAHFSASDAAAMLGVSKYKSRDQLLREKKLWQANPTDYWAEIRFKKGHELEDKARPIAEAIHGEDLYPVTGTSEEYPKLLASFDGLTMLEDTCWEHKMWNRTLSENVRNNMLEDHYWPQLEQQLLVSGATCNLFMTSDGTKENCVHFYYESDPARRQKIIEGWEQFEKDLDAYELAPKVEVVKAEEPISLPAVIVNVVGTDITSNINECLLFVQRLAEEELSKPLNTDLDLANKEAMNKAVKAARDKLKKTVDDVQSEFISFSEFSTVAKQIDTVLQKMFSAGDKAVKSRKEDIKREIIDGADAELEAHIIQINQRLQSVVLPPIERNFLSAIKGKRNFDSMKSAVGSALAEAKIEANKVAVIIEDNLQVLVNEAEGYEFLFSDLQQIVTKPHGDFINLVKLRKAEHVQAEESCRNAERLEAEQAYQEPLQQARSATTKHIELSWSLSSWKIRNEISSEAFDELIDLLESFGINILEYKKSA